MALEAYNLRGDQAGTEKDISRPAEALEAYNLRGDQAGTEKDISRPAEALETYNLRGHQTGTEKDISRPAKPVLAPAPAASQFRRIGVGNCGSVWTHGDAPFAWKRADGSETRYMWKEYYMQSRLLEALKRMGNDAPSVRVPTCYWYTNPQDTELWSTQLPRFPVTKTDAGTLIQQEPAHTMCSERIPPVSNTFREALIDRYCHPKAKEEIRHSDANTDCLARLYLGRRRLNDRPKMFFSLRNCPITLDQALELGLPVNKHAEEMADALAAMHWEAQIDANDVEFVLASPRTSPAVEDLPSSTTIVHLPYNSCTRWQEPGLQAYPPQAALSEQLDLWLLDFDCCNAMTLDDEGMEVAAAAFYRNDPFYPRPCEEGSEDFGLWKVFETRYLVSSRKILERRRGMDLELGRKFIDCLVARSRMSKHERSAPKAAKDGQEDTAFYKCFVAHLE